jgi:hypothetical protein
MTVELDALRALEGMSLPGGSLLLEPYESLIADRAFRAADSRDEAAHPAWFVVASLRCLGIDVDELCSLAHKEPEDTLLFGGCEVVQLSPLRPGTRYDVHAQIVEVGSRRTRDGARLDTVAVCASVLEPDGPAGRVTSTYLFKRKADDDAPAS